MAVRIPEGWEYWCLGGRDWGEAWEIACALKQQRERLRPDLMVRVRVVKGPGVYWVLRREETRQETGT